MSQKKNKKNAAGSDPHRRREQAKYDAPIASREFITSVLSSNKGPMDIEALAAELNLSGNPVAEEALRRRVGAMIRDGQLIQNRKRGLVPVDTDALIAGRISAHADGFGFVIADDGDKDIYLNGKQMRQVLHGDRVVVCVTGIDHRGRREGRIVDVVERANKSLVGRLSIDRGTAVVLPDNKRIHQDLLIAPGALENAQDGDMVVAEIVEQPTRRHQPVGRIVEVLGQHLKAGMEIDVALHSHGIPVDWPEAVTDQAASFSTNVDNSLAKDRKDVRDLPLITIDGIDARDFDDAVWCEPLESGWRLMVAIADVAHYVTAGSALDDEAVERGTSVYFPGRVVPMLPEVLSNGLCSLNPEVDRLCMICEMTLDESAQVKKTRFHNGIMRSHARLTYDQVGEMLSDKGSALRDEYAPLMPMIDEMYLLYKALAAKRRSRGAIEFDSNETHIIFDDNKKIKEIIPIQRNDAHKLIEECMILANIEAAAYLEVQEIPALYRVHAGPKSDRLIDLRAFLALRGLTLGGGDLPSAIDYAALAEQISERTDRSVIQTVMLRSMQQAVYQPKNEGHFGLALEQYAHFTSPIRRYPDLLVHRAIKHALLRGKPADYRYSKEAMQVLGESCSMTERRAEEASRDVVSWLKCEFMQEHVGSEFPGVISAVTSFGLFVELVGIHVEGLVHITNLSRDYYRFEQAAHALTGERTGKQYHLGDAIVVRVAAVNLEERKIDFSEVGQQGESGQQPANEKRRGKKPHKKSSHRKKYAPENKPVPKEQTAAVAGNAGNTSQKTESAIAEKRRQDKRRLKQKRRDAKRAARKEAQRLESLRLASQNSQPGAANNDTASTDKPVGKQSGKANGKGKSRRQRKDANKVAAIANTGNPATAAKAAAGSVVNNASDKTDVRAKTKVASKAAVKESGKKVASNAAGKARSKLTSQAAVKESGKKVASKAASKAQSKLTSQATVKASGKKVASKAASKAQSKSTSQAAVKASGKKVASKAASKAQSKSTSQAAVKASGKKVASKAASKVQSKSTSQASAKASGKKVASKAASKARSKLASQAAVKASGKKVTSKAASKARSKLASQAAVKTSGKKVAGKAASKARSKLTNQAAVKTSSKKAASKAAGKARAKVTSQAAAKASGKKVASKAGAKARGKKAVGKVASKTKAKVTSKVAAKASGKKIATNAKSKTTVKKKKKTSTGKATAKSKSQAKSKVAGRRSGRGRSS